MRIMFKIILITCLLFVCYWANAQYSGSGPVTMTTPVGASNIQWYEYTASGANAIVGETNSSFTTDTPGVYYAIFDNTAVTGCTGQQTNFAIIMNEGDTLTFNGSTNNSGAVSYQWYNDSTMVAGATTADLNVTEGGLYSLEITNATCSVTTDSYYVFEIIANEPDLTPTIDINSLNFAVTGTSRDFIVNLFEIADKPSISGSAITFRLNKLSGFDISYPSTSGMSTVLGGINNSNSDWIFSENTNFINVTAKSGIALLNTGSKKIGFNVTRKSGIPSNTEQNLTVTVLFGSGGEKIFTNNIVETTLTAN